MHLLLKTMFIECVYGPAILKMVAVRSNSEKGAQSFQLVSIFEP